MLIKATAVYLAANVFSAIFGFVNVTVFTRVFPTESFGDYLLGLSFATVFSTFLGTSLKLWIVRNQSRGDGTDVRGVALAGLLICIVLLPLGYGTARLAGLKPSIALAAIGLSFAVVVFESSQEVLRAQQMSTAFLRGTMARAVLVSAFGISCVLISKSGAMLLGASSIAFLLATLTFWRTAWGSAAPRVEIRLLRELAINGLPLTLSLSLMTFSGMADRFLIANLSGIAAAGKFGASLDLVRQCLIIPAISASSAFVPMSVRLMAAGGPKATRLHLETCLELLLAIVLPASIGFAIVSPQISDLILGPDFRQAAREAMPVLSIAVVFQILNQQYLHTSFLLSNRNIFWFVSTGVALSLNIALAFLLIPSFGIIGAVWGRFAAEALGCGCSLWLSAYSFPMPFPGRRVLRVLVAVGLMAIALRISEAAVQNWGAEALLVLIPVGIIVYGAAAWLLNLAGARAAGRQFYIQFMSPASFWRRHLA